jgi:hypothetical protein
MIKLGTRGGWRRVRAARPALAAWCLCAAGGGALWGGFFMGAGLNDAVKLALMGAEEVPAAALPARLPAWIAVTDGEASARRAVLASWTTRSTRKGGGHYVTEHSTFLTPVEGSGDPPRAWACAKIAAPLDGPVQGVTGAWRREGEAAYRRALAEAGLEAAEDAFCVWVGDGDLSAHAAAARRDALRAFLLFHLLAALPAAAYLLFFRRRPPAPAQG